MLLLISLRGKLYQQGLVWVWCLLRRWTKCLMRFPIAKAPSVLGSGWRLFACIRWRLMPTKEQETIQRTHGKQWRCRHMTAVFAWCFRVWGDKISPEAFKGRLEASWSYWVSGGSVVRMVNGVLGKELFREGLGLYMRRFAYRCLTALGFLWRRFGMFGLEAVATKKNWGNTDSSDLWSWCLANMFKHPVLSWACKCVEVQ